MHMTDSAQRFSVSFRLKGEYPEKALHAAIARFVDADVRWASVLELAAAGLSPSARRAFATALGGLDAGPAPRLLPFMIEPDDAQRLADEAQHMSTELVGSLGVIAATMLGLGHPEVATVHGLVTAVHRLLRIAKTRP